jgi:hypothetical protein
MKTENKYIIMVWSIVALAIMNVTTLATILYHNYKSNKTDFNQVVVQAQSASGGMNLSGRFFRDELNLNHEQMERFREFNPVFREKVRAITAELNKKRMQMLKEMSDKNSDIKRLDDISDSIGMLHSSLKKLIYRYYLDIKNICTENQQEKLNQIFTTICENESSFSCSGNSNMRGRHKNELNNK